LLNQNTVSGQKSRSGDGLVAEESMANVRVKKLRGREYGFWCRPAWRESHGQSAVVVAAAEVVDEHLFDGLVVSH
jgi:hypothetical protein